MSLLQVGSKILLELRKTNKDINIGTFLSLLDKIEEFYKEDIVKMMLRGLFQKNLNSMDSRQTGI